MGMDVDTEVEDVLLVGNEGREGIPVQVVTFRRKSDRCDWTYVHALCRCMSVSAPWHAFGLTTLECMALT